MGRKALPVKAGARIVEAIPIQVRTACASLGIPQAIPILSRLG